MRFDLDMDRDDAAAFGPESLTNGALLPFEGRALMQSPDGLPAAALDADRDGWLSPSNPVLVRGSAKILPLAWLGDGSGASAEEIAAFASQMQAAGMHWAGNWRVLDLAERRNDSVGSFAAALRAAGVTKADCWTYSETIGVALVWAGAEGEGTMSLALQVLPVSWVSERRAERAVRGIDVRWSWADVVALRRESIAAETSEAADILAEQNREGQGS